MPASVASSTAGDSRQEPGDSSGGERVTEFFQEALKRSSGRRSQKAKQEYPLQTIQLDNGTETVLSILRRNWQEKQHRKANGEEETDLRDTIQELRQQSDAIQTVRKERVFDDEITEEEMDIIQQRVALQQRQFQEYQRRENARKFAKIRNMFEYLRTEEIEEALEEANNDEDAAILKFTQTAYLMKLRKRIAEKHQPIQSEVVMTEEQQQAYERLVEKRKKAAKKTTTEESKKRCIRFSRLRLDDALSQLENGVDPAKVFEGWSDARVRAYKQIKTKPNSYYYRFNAPGEKQRNGPWTKEERTMFFKRLEEVGADGQWGIFSIAIPGRVGYQCSNFYRHLLKTGEIVDENYTIDSKGELRYLFGKKEGGKGVIRVHSKHGSGGARSQNGGGKKRKRKSAYGDEDDDDDGNVDDLFDQDDSGNFTCKASWATTRRTRARMEAAEAESEGTPVDAYENPLAGFVDPITLEEVVKPAISPYGHVMSYASWIRCLSSEERKNICPLTKKPLTKRELVVLTYDNIDEYRRMVPGIHYAHSEENPENQAQKPVGQNMHGRASYACSDAGTEQNIFTYSPPLLRGCIAQRDVQEGSLTSSAGLVFVQSNPTADCLDKHSAVHVMRPTNSLHLLEFTPHIPHTMGDRQNLVSNAAPIAGASVDLEAGGQPFSNAGQPAASENIFKQSSHPIALFFHLAFRTGAMLTYLFCSLFTGSYVLPFVIIVLLLAFDFWTVKNVTGRLLVGLRWWNEIKEDGSTEWKFESRENRIVNATDSRVFWFSLYLTPAIWALFAFFTITRVMWLLITIVAITMSMANVIGYTKCEKNAKAKVTNFIAGQGVVQGFVGSMISNRLGGLFVGGGGAAGR
ncbi:uncharacterized protein SPPG_09139 [Spizellomyces punctatus DAOM BR117]|uniref:Golgi apparatus membrane protein TVP23 n=1 Tax=Spizellomyces punctatus (strain DAOM BR117) TaxID=645134 RepID=A0A0L0HHR2_SPIPD|nr:uncharacterized protein SPPG_09139 [Spizellomyces punctatus DAOM BR117]KND00622.1 hypothetical protein SPPG_09139 [Spizellomyces punctatus DAOM BR117]|eukprot:XP_016608661.1 hypothetical protein SPPG_09139 [Spizellomyces punctatus DAOM BR117]